MWTSIRRSRGLQIVCAVSLVAATVMVSLWAATPVRVAAEVRPVSTESATHVEAIPPSVRQDGWGAVLDEWDRRLTAWSDEVGATELSERDLVATMDLITQSIGELRETSDLGFIVRELASRRELLCRFLPPDHVYRGGAYCA